MPAETGTRFGTELIETLISVSWETSPDPAGGASSTMERSLEEKISAILCYESQLELMRMEGAARLKVLGKSSPIFDSPIDEVIPISIRAVAEEEGKKANLPLAESFNVRGLGILENIKNLVGGLSV